jgi:hypothetical protein
MLILTEKVNNIKIKKKRMKRTFKIMAIVFNVNYANILFSYTSVVGKVLKEVQSYSMESLCDWWFSSCWSVGFRNGWWCNRLSVTTKQAWFNCCINVFTNYDSESNNKVKKMAIIF